MKRLLAVASLGSAVGVGVLGVDLGLLRLTLGYLGDFDVSVVVAYAGAGALLAAAAQVALEWRGAPATTGSALCLTSALLYLPSMVERIEHLLSASQLPGRFVVAIIAGAGVYLGWFGLLLRTGRDLRSAATLTALSAALALAANRNLAPGAFSTQALRLDAAIAGSTLALAWAVRLRGGARAAAGAIAAAGFTLFVGFVPREGRAELPSTGGRNLFLVVIDTLRLDVFADVVASTPEGERFSRALSGATWFDHATAIAPWTAPSMASILTGLYPAEHGFDSPGSAGEAIPPLAPHIETLAQRLEREGYHCEGLVTQPYIRPGTGMERGFAHYELIEGAAERLPFLVALTRVGLVDPPAYQPAASVRRRFVQRLDQLGGRRSSLFFFVHLLDPHVPLHSHPELPFEDSNLELAAEESLYRQEVRYALREVAAMIELLAEEGVLSQSVLAVTADHGELFPSDRRYGRPRGDGTKQLLQGHGGALYDELLRVPLVVLPAGARVPGSERHTDALASHVDLVPTFLELLGLPMPLAADRFSLASDIAGRPGSSTFRATAPSGVNVAGLNPALPAQVALRSRRYWLIDYLDTELPDELYDLKQDPGERTNLAVVQPELLELFRAELKLARPWLTPPLVATAPRELDDSTRRRLRSLGYL